MEPTRITAPYRVVREDHTEHTDLIYSYEEPVFDPDDPASRNLACMVTAQLALNYGLFCRSMLFHGIYDDTDRRFIREMAENTAREIYVKKFLEPNPFLTGEAASLTPSRRRRYLNARIRFTDDRRSRDEPAWRSWENDKDRYAILSSGGKDSLLSFGLINETGREVHPLFVNESGRHWFTALNAYRHFKNHVPHTARVWVNSDRVFAWMLRQLPFIRRDFAHVRSDDYPVRLWTVAVFLFATVPLMKKRRIGNILIGDEYDTTRRVTSHGITHYDGLFDQSRYFDNTLSRYYLRKGWSIKQFSILRPLSELLIEKILTERYPLIQRHQISCHAAHREGDRVLPCGKCEKCRRIVGMLSALGADPSACGYGPEKIRACLKNIAGTRSHQDSDEAEHLLSLLLQADLIEPPPTGPSPRPRAEVMKLRFDPVRSPMDAVPVELRRPLYGIFMSHCQGAVKRAGRVWKDIAPLNDPHMDLPYPFEADSPAAARILTPFTSAGSKRYLWGELNWPDAEDYLNRMDVAILPVGAIEQHGPHLPTDTDAFDADYLARRVAEACSDPRPLVLPVIAYGVSYHHDDFKGTVGIGNDTLSRLVYDIGISVARNGIRKLVIINGHGGNAPALNYAAQMINRDEGIFVCVDTGETSDVDIDALVETPNDVHAGEIETSTALAIRPHLVRMDRARKCVPAFSSRYLDFSSRRGVSWYAYTKKISDSGVMGDPTKASAEKGERMWELMLAHLVGLVEDIKSMTLDEIHHRDY